MTTSGTVGQTTIGIDYICDAVARRCGVVPATLTPESIEAIKNTLHLLLSNWSNKGVNLWRLQRPLLGLAVGQATYELPTGTIDVLNANFRTPTRLDSTPTSSAGGTAANATDGDTTTVLTQTSSNGNVSFDLGSALPVNMVGILPGTSATWNLILEYSTDNIAWSTADDLASVAYVDNQWAWYELDPAHTAQYFRVRETGGGTLVLREVYLCKDWYDVPMYRMSKDDYSSLPNKRFQANQVYQYWLDRQLTPAMVLWPTPASSFYVLALQTHVHIEDVGQMTNTLDLPQRWLDAAIWCTAKNVILELPGADLQRLLMLKELAVEPQFDAAVEERDKSPIVLTPNIRPYTR